MPFRADQLPDISLPNPSMPKCLPCVTSEGSEIINVSVNGRLRPRNPVPLLVEDLKKKLSAEDQQYLKSTYTFVGTPCYGNTLTVAYSQAITQVQLVFMLMDIPINVVHIGTESLIPRGRNGMCAEFMGGPYTHLLFIDADIGNFSAVDVINMLLLRKPVVSAIYPLKRLNFDHLRQMIRSGEADRLNDAQLMSITNSYVYNPLPQSEVEPGGIVRVLDLPTGFMMIHKPALERIKHLAEPYVNDVSAYDTPQSKGEFHNYFGCTIDPKSGRFLSEDYAISRRFQEAGVETYAYMSVPLSHTGSYTWSGRVGDSVVMRQPMHVRQQLAKAMKL